MGNGVGEGSPGEPHHLKACVHLWDRHLTKPHILILHSYLADF